MKLNFVALPLLTAQILGCASSVIGTDGGSQNGTTARGTGFLADGADPFIRTDANDTGPLTDGSWTLPEASVSNRDERYGYLTFGLYGFSQPSELNYAQVTFRLFYYPDDPRCMYYALGDWALSDCSVGGTPPPDPHPRPFPHAGAVTFSGRQRAVLEPDRTGDYASFTQFEQYFVPGEYVQISAQGATVPMFRAMLQIPESLQIEVIGAVNGAINRNRELRIRWTPSTAEEVSIRLMQTYNGASGERSLQLYASPYGDETSVTIPREFLARLQPGTPLQIQAIPYNKVNVQAGSWPVSIWASGMGHQQDYRVE